MQFEGNKAGEERAKQEPNDRRSVKHQDRHARRSINQSALDLI
jgi:hypothetical protein